MNFRPSACAPSQSHAAPKASARAPRAPHQTQEPPSSQSCGRARRQHRPVSRRPHRNGHLVHSRYNRRACSTIRANQRSHNKTPRPPPSKIKHVATMQPRAALPESKSVATSQRDVRPTKKLPVIPVKPSIKPPKPTRPSPKQLPSKKTRSRPKPSMKKIPVKPKKQITRTAKKVSNKKPVPAKQLVNKPAKATVKKPRKPATRKKPTPVAKKRSVSAKRQAIRKKPKKK